jgi:putative membrane protein
MNTEKGYGYMQTIPNEELKLGDKLAIERTDLAVDRTAMAADRTLMAWTRTAISMISFGFTIYKILHGAFKEGMLMTSHPEGPRNLGLFLIGIGTFSLGLGMLEHWHTKRALSKKPRFLLMNPSFLTSSAIILLGLFLFVTIILKMEIF